MLITVMSEGELHVPRLGRVAAVAGFRLVAAMNPFDAIGTARISGAVYDRVCRLAVGYQSAADEARSSPGARRATDGLDPALGRQGRRARAAHPHPSRPAHRLVGARGDRHVRRGVVAWRSCAASRRRPASVVARRRARRAVRPGAAPRGQRPARPRTSSPSCGRSVFGHGRTTGR